MRYAHLWEICKIRRDHTFAQNQHTHMTKQNKSCHLNHSFIHSLTDWLTDSSLWGLVTANDHFLVQCLQQIECLLGAIFFHCKHHMFPHEAQKSHTNWCRLWGWKTPKVQDSCVSQSPDTISWFTCHQHTCMIHMPSTHLHDSHAINTPAWFTCHQHTCMIHMPSTHLHDSHALNTPAWFTCPQHTCSACNAWLMTAEICTAWNAINHHMTRIRHLPCSHLGHLSIACLTPVTGVGMLNSFFPKIRTSFVKFEFVFEFVLLYQYGR